MPEDNSVKNQRTNYVTKLTEEDNSVKNQRTNYVTKLTEEELSQDKELTFKNGIKLPIPNPSELDEKLSESIKVDLTINPSNVKDTVSPIAKIFSNITTFFSEKVLTSKMLKTLGVTTLIVGTGAYFLNQAKRKSASNKKDISDPKKSSETNIINSAKARQKKEAKESLDIANFTSTSLKKNLEVAKNSVSREMDTKNKEKLGKKSKVKANKIRKEAYNVNIIPILNKPLEKETIEDNSKKLNSEINNINYKASVVKEKKISNQDVINTIDKKLEKQDKASKERDKILGKSILEATSKNDSSILNQINKSSKKSTNESKTIIENIEKQDSSTRGMIQDSNSSIIEVNSELTDQTQELIIEGNERLSDSNNVGIKALSEQLYESEKAQEDARIEELKAQNESEAKLDELIDYSNNSFNMSAVLDRTNQLLATTVETLKRPEDTASRIQEWIGNLAYSLGTIYAQIDTLIKPLGKGLKKGLVFLYDKLFSGLEWVVNTAFSFTKAIAPETAELANKVAKVVSGSLSKVFMSLTEFLERKRKEAGLLEFRKKFLLGSLSDITGTIGEGLADVNSNGIDILNKIESGDLEILDKAQEGTVAGLNGLNNTIKNTVRKGGRFLKKITTKGIEGVQEMVSSGRKYLEDGSLETDYAGFLDKGVGGLLRKTDVKSFEDLMKRLAPKVFAEENKTLWDKILDGQKLLLDRQVETTLRKIGVLQAGFEWDPNNPYPYSLDNRPIIINNNNQFPTNVINNGNKNDEANYANTDMNAVNQQPG